MALGKNNFFRALRLRLPVLEEKGSAKDGGRAIGNLHAFAAQIEQSFGAARIAEISGMRAIIESAKKRSPLEKAA